MQSGTYCLYIVFYVIGENQLLRAYVLDYKCHVIVESRVVFAQPRLFPIENIGI